MRRALNWRGTELGLREVVLELFFIIQDKGGLLDGLVYFLKDFLQFLLEAVVGDVVQDECTILEALNCGLGFFDDDGIWIRGEKDFRVVEGDVLGVRERAFRKALNTVSVEGPAKDLFSPSYLESLFELVPVCRWDGPSEEISLCSFLYLFGIQGKFIEFRDGLGLVHFLEYVFVVREPDLYFLRIS